MNKNFTVSPVTENGTIKLGYEERGISRRIFAVLLEAGVKHETASHILTVVDDLYRTSDNLHKAFDLNYNTAVFENKEIGEECTPRQ